MGFHLPESSLFSFLSFPSAKDFFLCMSAACMCSLTHQKCLSSTADSVCFCLWCAKFLHCYLSHLRFFLPFNSLTGRKKEPNQDPCTCPSLASQFDTMFDKFFYPLKPLILVCNAGLTRGLNTHKMHKISSQMLRIIICL